MIKDKEQIINLIRKNQDTISNYGVSKIGLFGSYVRGDQEENSDIDLIVQFKKGEKSYMKFFKLSEYLESLFDKKVDLLTDVGISPLVKLKIEKEIIYVSFRT
jgi:hypothetical protein